MWMIFFVLLCCGGTSWSSAEDCRNLPKGDNKDNCWSVHLVDFFQQDRREGMRIIREDISSSRVQDFLWLEVTREIDPTTIKYCKEIKASAVAERCRVLVSRPHLHRDVLRNKGSGGVPAKKPQ